MGGIMMQSLEVTQTLTKHCPSNKQLICEQIKITNISTDYIHNLRLIIDDKEHALIQQLITRERGSLVFSPDTTCLELGNLAPDESAYFEYTYASSKPNAFKSHISLTYTNPDNAFIPEKKIAEFLLDSTIK